LIKKRGGGNADPPELVIISDYMGILTPVITFQPILLPLLETRVSED
jgi:hypothetical protein